MGSQSDWPTLSKAVDTLADFDVSYETQVVGAPAHPQLLYEYARSAQERGLKCIVAGAGSAAHLPGMTASMTTLPVLGVPSKIQDPQWSGFSYQLFRCRLVSLYFCNWRCRCHKCSPLCYFNSCFRWRSGIAGKASGFSKNSKRQDP